MELAVTKVEKRSVLHERLDALQKKHGYASIRWGITYSLERVERTEALQ